MEYRKLISVTGLGGLFELLSSKSDGAIVRSLEDRTTKFVSSRIHNFSHLESIEIYTTSDNVNLVDVFDAMGKSKDALPDVKDAAALKTYFGKVYPTIDFERVYSSDLKKMVKWFQSLKANNVEMKLTELPAEAEPVAETEAVAPVVEEAAKPAPKKKAATKKAAPSDEAAADTAEAPKKKVARKKKED
jgi:hypothetical protein